MESLEQSHARFEREAIRWLPDVARFARSLTGDDSDADDLVQDTFLLAFRQWHQFRPGTECRAWLFTICRNRQLRVHDRERRYVAGDVADFEALAVRESYHAAKARGLDDAFEREETCQAVRDAIEELPEVYREVTILVDLSECTYDEAATTLGVPVGTVRSRLFRARRLLQERLLSVAEELQSGRARRPPSEERTT